MTTNNGAINPLERYRDVTVADVTQATIAASATVSAVINSGALRLQGLVLPAGFTTSDITFTTGYDPLDVNYALMTGDGVNTIAAIKMVGCAASQWIELNPAWFNGIKYFKINTSNAQASAVIIKCIFNPLYQGIHG